jgi:hypothetical protein
MCSADCQTALYLTGSFCGDGVLNAGHEECDEPSISCGTCGAPSTDEACRFIVSPGNTPPDAQGTITVNSITGLVGVTFTLDDDVRTGSLYTFEFIDSTFVPQSDDNNVKVDIAGSTTIDAVAAKIVDAVNQAKINIEAAVCVSNCPSGGTMVMLTNTVAGIYGNAQVTVEALTNVPSADVTALTVAGMSNGSGCPTGVRCRSDQDCVSGNSCRATAGQQQKKTCNRDNP